MISKRFLLNMKCETRLTGQKHPYLITSVIIVEVLSLVKLNLINLHENEIKNVNYITYLGDAIRSK